MTGQSVRITKISPDGRPVFSYGGEVVYRSKEVVVARCPWPLAKVVDLGPFRLEQGDIFMEYYYPQDWFNIFAVHDARGVLKGWYCNITEPTEFRDGEILWHDWALDLLVLPSGQQAILDREEFESLQPPPAVRERAEAALATLQRWAAEGHPPFGWNV